jgi:hypothetical protein
MEIGGGYSLLSRARRMSPRKDDVLAGAVEEAGREGVEVFQRVAEGGPEVFAGIETLGLPVWKAPA